MEEACPKDFLWDARVYWPKIKMVFQTPQNKQTNKPLFSWCFFELQLDSKPMHSWEGEIFTIQIWQQIGPLSLPQVMRKVHSRKKLQKLLLESFLSLFGLVNWCKIIIFCSKNSSHLNMSFLPWHMEYQQHGWCSSLVLLRDVVWAVHLSQDPLTVAASRECLVERTTNIFIMS